MEAHARAGVEIRGHSRQGEESSTRRRIYLRDQERRSPEQSEPLRPHLARIGRLWRKTRYTARWIPLRSIPETRRIAPCVRNKLGRWRVACYAKRSSRARIEPPTVAVLHVATTPAGAINSNFPNSLLRPP